MVSITYTGPHDGLDIAGVGTVARGASIPVSARLAAELVARGDFIHTPPAPRQKRPGTTATTTTTTTTEEG